MKQIILNGCDLNELLGAVRFIVKDELRRGPHQNSEDGDAILTIDEAAKFLTLSKATIYRLVSERGVPFAKKGKRLYFRKSELSKWVDEGRKKTLAELK